LIYHAGKCLVETKSTTRHLFTCLGSALLSREALPRRSIGISMTHWLSLRQMLGVGDPCAPRTVTHTRSGHSPWEQAARAGHSGRDICGCWLTSLSLPDWTALGNVQDKRHLTFVTGGAQQPSDLPTARDVRDVERVLVGAV
jgi:hypothetical protein